jgi:hypothetical protein
LLTSSQAFGIGFGDVVLDAGLPVVEADKLLAELESAVVTDDDLEPEPHPDAASTAITTAAPASAIRHHFRSVSHTRAA